MICKRTMIQQKDCGENKRIETAIERIIEYLFNYTPNFKRTRSKIELMEKFWEKTGISSNRALWEYMVFQGSMIENSRYKEMMFDPYNLIGPKAIEKWNKRGKYQVFIANKRQRERGWISPFKEEEEGLSERYREMLRKKYWNKEKGFILCSQYGGWLFDKNRCKDCIFYKVCEK